MGRISVVTNKLNSLERFVVPYPKDGILLHFNFEYDQILSVTRVSLIENELPFEFNPNENRQSFDEFIEFSNSLN